PRPHARSGGRDLLAQPPDRAAAARQPVEPMRRRRKRAGRMSPFAAGLVAIVAILLFTYLGFTKFANPFASPYTVHAIFSSANGLRPNSLVRVAGVNVGKVSSVQPASGCKSGSSSQQCSAADVTMTIDDQGLPIHQDAT